MKFRRCSVAKRCLKKCIRELFCQTSYISEVIERVGFVVSASVVNTSSIIKSHNTSTVGVILGLTNIFLIKTYSGASVETI